ncbi:MAG: DUF1569 domain-containing protein [Spirochaetales bacterium]|nr:DUF1569 domain-containing protein [Spirochaetales bacterium]
MKKKAVRLRFQNLAEAQDYIKNLVFSGKTSGNWTAEEILTHLSAAVECTLYGFSAQYPRLIRRSIGSVFGRLIFAMRFFPAGVPNIRAIPHFPVPREGNAFEIARHKLLGLIAQLQQGEPVKEHPFFGPLSREKWFALHTYHLAHHLSYIVVLDDVNFRNSQSGRTALMDAVAAGEISALHSLLEAGANPDLADEQGNVPLHYAVMEGNLEAGRILLQAGANPNARDRKGITPLNLCRSLAGMTDFSRLLLEKGADPGLTDHSGKTYQM